MSLRDEWKSAQRKGGAGLIWTSLDAPAASEWTVIRVPAKRLSAEEIRRILPSPFAEDV